MTKRNIQKEADVMKLYNTGLYTLQEIGEMMPSFGHLAISRQRVLQIILRYQNEKHN